MLNNQDYNYYDYKQEPTIIDELIQAAEFFAWCALIVDAFIGIVFFVQLFLNMIGW